MTTAVGTALALASATISTTTAAAIIAATLATVGRDLSVSTDLRGRSLVETIARVRVVSSCDSGLVRLLRLGGLRVLLNADSAASDRDSSVPRRNVDRASHNGLFTTQVALESGLSVRSLAINI